MPLALKIMQKLVFQVLQGSLFKTSEYVEDENPKGDKRWKSFNFNWWLIDFAHGVSVHQCLNLRDSPLMVKNRFHSSHWTDLVMTLSNEQTKTITCVSWLETCEISAPYLNNGGSVEAPWTASARDPSVNSFVLTTLSSDKLERGIIGNLGSWLMGCGDIWGITYE